MRNLLVMAIVVISGAAWADADNPECLGADCGAPKEEGGGGGGACVAGVCQGGGCSVWVAYTDDGKTLAYTDDADGDGIGDTHDNCPFSANRDQLDVDGDGVGNSCDNCGAASNFSQLDTDGDGQGDLCDADLDGDGLANALDNCANIPNPGQLDTDHNGQGDVCSTDKDGDGFPDAIDLCPLLPSATNVAISDARCNTDFDGDGVLDATDNCPMVASINQLDTDGDGIGDVCDNDIDNDGIVNAADNCSMLRNRGQWDDDGDGMGDACDSHYCVVIDPTNKEDCLDPQAPFRVHGGGSVMLKAGEKFALPLFANRAGVGLDYVWTVSKRPSGSSAAVTHPKGHTATGHRWQYHYEVGQAPTFTADVDGEYSLQLQASLTDPDRAYPESRNSVSELKMTATPDGKPGSMSCSAVPEAVTAMWFSVAALVGMALRRRRS